MTIIPQHPLARCALDRARGLAELLCPLDDDEQLVADCIVQAAREGDLYATAEAMFDATLRNWVTAEWKEWGHQWLAKVKASILSDVSEQAA